MEPSEGSGLDLTSWKREQGAIELQMTKQGNAGAVVPCEGRARGEWQ
jgi:hypothetical protein